MFTYRAALRAPLRTALNQSRLPRAAEASAPYATAAQASAPTCQFWWASCHEPVAPRRSADQCRRR